MILGSMFAFAAAAQPGPMLTFLIQQTLLHGWRKTAPTVLAPLMSDIPIALMVLVLLGQIPPAFLRALQLAGGLLLLALAVSAFRSWKNLGQENRPSSKSLPASLLKAAGVNILNPAPWLGWSLVLGPLFLKGWREHPGNGIGLVCGFYFTMIATTLGIMGAFSLARRHGPRLNRLFIGLSAVILAAFGCIRIYSGIKGI
jgi:threonine/homoserine/homoserine lactone efflux protein